MGVKEHVPKRVQFNTEARAARKLHKQNAFGIKRLKEKPLSSEQYLYPIMIFPKKWLQQRQRIKEVGHYTRKHEDLMIAHEGKKRLVCELRYFVPGWERASCLSIMTTKKKLTKSERIELSATCIKVHYTWWSMRKAFNKTNFTWTLSLLNRLKHYWSFLRNRCVDEYSLLKAENIEMHRHRHWTPEIHRSSC